MWVLIHIQQYLEVQKTEKSKFVQELPDTVTVKAQDVKRTLVLITGGVLILWRIVLHVIDGVHLWGIGIGIIAGIIVGLIEGIIVAIVLCGILYVVLSILFSIDNRSSIKREQDSTNQILNRITQELTQINEQKNNFVFTFVTPASPNTHVPTIARKTGQVISINGSMAQIMDLKAFTTFEIPIPDDKQNLVEVGKQFTYIELMDTKKINWD